jgi:hypothetical protein
MKVQISAISASIATAALLAWPTAASALKDLVIDVNCASGDRIERALDRINVLDRRMIIVVNGTCSENVVIERDDVTLKAGGSGGGVSAADASNPSILINGARRVVLENLAVNGGHDGVRITAGAAATIRGGSIRNAAFIGIRADSSSSVIVEGSTIEGHGQGGVTVIGSSATVTSSAVRRNGYSGVASLSGAAIVLGRIDDAGNVCTLCGNIIEENRLDGLTVARAGSARLYGNVVQGNGTTTNRWGVLAAEESFIWLEGGNRVSGNGSPTGGGGVFAKASSVRTGSGDQPISPSSNEVSGNTIGIQAISGNLQLQGGLLVTGNSIHGVALDQSSRLRTESSTITNNGVHGIYVVGASGAGLILGGVNNVSGNGNYGLFCADSNSHYFGNTVGISGNMVGQVGCTPF